MAETRLRRYFKAECSRRLDDDQRVAEKTAGKLGKKRGGAKWDVQAVWVKFLSGSGGKRQSFRARIRLEQQVSTINCYS